MNLTELLTKSSKKQTNWLVEYAVKIGCCNILKPQKGYYCLLVCCSILYE